MQQERRSVNSTEGSSRAAANNNNSSGISRPAVTPFQKKSSPSLPENELNPDDQVLQPMQVSVNSSVPIVQRTVADALEYYNSVTNNHVESEDEVDFDLLKQLRKYSWYMRKRRQGKREDKRPHRRKRKRETEQTQTKEPGTLKSTISESRERPVKKRKKIKSGNHERVGVVTWNIAHFGFGKDSLELNKKKINEIVDMFAKNSWLDIMVLQEVNNIDLFRKLLAGKKIEILTGGQSMGVLKKTGAMGQSEEYPILVREGSGWELTGTEDYYPGSDGGVWEDQDDTKKRMDVVEDKGKKVKALPPEMPLFERIAYGNLTDEQRKEQLPDYLKEYVEKLEQDYGNKKINFDKYLDSDTEKNFRKWNENHGKRNVWRDRGGNSELVALIEQANVNLEDFIEKINENLRKYELQEFDEAKPLEKNKKNQANKAYYRQLQSWVNSVILWLDGLSAEEFSNDIAELYKHLHNIDTMINIDNEENSTYRPIRRYEIGNVERNVNLALNVVHTSPSDQGKSGDGKKRKKVYSQISPALKDMSERNNSNEMLIGDLYINPKDLVEDGKTAQTAFDELGVKIAGDTTASTNRWSGRGKVRYNQADIILVNNKSKVKGGGIVKLGTGGLESVDKKHVETDKWTKKVGRRKALSDHAPVGAIVDLEKGISVKTSKKLNSNERDEEREKKVIENPFRPLFGEIF